MSHSLSKIGVGTVAFGQDYGVGGKGRVSGSEVGAILKFAADHGSILLDTARLYGDSEEVLGREQITQRFPKLVTKFPKIGKDFNALEAAFERSTDLLRRESLYGLLAHRFTDLVGEVGKRNFAGLEALKDTGKVAKIGVSVYGPSELERVLETGSIDLVQLPLSVFDQRFLKSGLLDELSNAGVEIHVRSVYLQGLPFVPLSKLSPFFDPVRPKLIGLHEIANSQGWSVASLCLNFALSRVQVDHVLIGFTTVSEVEETLGLVGESPLVDFDELAFEDETFAIPSNWNV